MWECTRWNGITIIQWTEVHVYLIKVTPNVARVYILHVTVIKLYLYIYHSRNWFTIRRAYVLYSVASYTRYGNQNVYVCTVWQSERVCLHCMAIRTCMFALYGNQNVYVSTVWQSERVCLHCMAIRTCMFPLYGNHLLFCKL